MDEFLRDIHTTIFYHWIVSKILRSGISFHHSDDQITIETLYGKAVVVFYKFNIIELRVTDLQETETLFFLHFQMSNIAHATSLFNEMMDCLNQLKSKAKIKVLLCCSGGLTTNYFACQLNEANEFLKKNYEIAAIGYTHLFEVEQDYQIIMLAPQISYLKQKIQAIYQDKKIINIPPQIFARYDVSAMFALLEKTLSSQPEKTMPDYSRFQKYIQTHGKKILCISVNRNSRRVHIAYRLYYQEKLLASEKNIKMQITMQDIYDVIDTMLLHHDNITTIALCMPGIINDGQTMKATIKGITERNFKVLLKQRYSQEIVITNDVNTAAIGYHALHHYQSLVLLFQPVSSDGGAGIIIDDKLVNGIGHVAGEIQYLPMLKQVRQKKPYTPETIFEVVKTTIITFISILGPEVLVLFCTMIYDVDKLIAAIEKEIPQRFIPKIVKIDDLEEYIFIGQMIECYQSSDTKKYGG